MAQLSVVMVYWALNPGGKHMKLGWYINRLRSMEPAELLHRLREKSRKMASRHRHQGWNRYPKSDYHVVLPQLREVVASASPEQRAAVAASAEAVLAGRFNALGRDWPQRQPEHLFPADLWRLDPVTGKTWPDAQTYGFDIDFRHNGQRGDIKYVWEVNRLQFLPVLAAYVLQSGDIEALKTIEAAIASWHDANPPYGGVAWASGIEVAIRAISLIITLDLLGKDLGVTARDKAGQILTASAFWLPRFPSRFSSANNHLVAELAGEYLLARALGRPDNAARSHLLAELEKQILPDGTGAEQTPTYAAFTAELVLLCTLAAKQSGALFPSSAGDRLAAFADFIAWLGPSGFGDDDEGRVLTAGHEADYPGSVASAINGLLDRPGIAASAHDFRAMVFGSPSSPIKRPQGLRTFANGGISLWRGDLAGHLAELSFDHGPLGYLSIAAHGHADALAMTLTLDGQPILVDPGTFLYGSGGIWRDWFRSTPAHNTLNLEGASQSTISGAFNWSHKARTTLLETKAEPGWTLEAQHDGYHSRYGTHHRRGLRLMGDEIIIIDQLPGGERQAELVFQLAPALEATASANVVTIRRANTPLLEITFPDGAIAIASGGEKPGQGGWVSPRFGERLPAPRLAWRGQVGASGVITRLRPLPSSQH